MKVKVTPIGKAAAAVPAATVPPGLLWRLPTVLQQYPTSRRAWYRGVADGIYPAPVKIGKRAVAWRSSDVLELVQERLSAVE